GYLGDWLPAWLDTCLEAGMWDLACELLAVAATVPHPADAPLFRDGWQRLRTAQRPSGALPEADGTPAALPAAAGYFAGHYHPTPPPTPRSATGGSPYGPPRVPPAPSPWRTGRPPPSRPPRGTSAATTTPPAWPPSRPS